ncbi:Art7 [Symbiodinium natans]|uniref:type I protein arginine methyltransferase n=1 Tax=Symbiodinium natans TaxID=878477 RepID=A0A812GNK1_9DINO|nr:Art7 [Symbiodinium natans]
MMNDAPRNAAFEAGIRSAISAARRPDGACRVVDLGCGAGLLSLLALRAGATEVLGVDHSPHLARCARRVLSQEEKVSVLCGDIRMVSFEEEDRFDVVVAELLDAGGLGEKIVPFMRHAKSRLLREGGRLVPRGLRIRACLLEARLPSASPSGKAGKAGEPGEPGEPVELSAFEPFWLPARAARSEWLGIDLDAGCEWVAASEAVEVFSLNFLGSHADLIEALQERDLRFPLSGHHKVNAVAWWFEADLGSGEEGACDLTSAPSRFRPSQCSATHWVQALAGIGPYDVPDGASEFKLRIRTDGVTLTWTPLAFDSATVPDAPERSEEVAAWSAKVAEASRQLQDMENRLDRVGDVARVQALQSAALSLAAQPGLFGLEAGPWLHNSSRPSETSLLRCGGKATPDVVARLLKGADSNESPRLKCLLSRGVWGSTLEAACRQSPFDIFRSSTTRWAEEEVKSEAGAWRDGVCKYLSKPSAPLAGVFHVVDARDFAQKLSMEVPSHCRPGEEVLINRRLESVLASNTPWLAADDRLIQSAALGACPRRYVLVVADCAQLSLGGSRRFLHQFYVMPFVAQQRRAFLREKLIREVSAAAAATSGSSTPEISVLLADSEQFYHSWEFWRLFWSCSVASE